jgi:hypothetical protein
MDSPRSSCKRKRMQRITVKDNVKRNRRLYNSNMTTFRQRVKRDIMIILQFLPTNFYEKIIEVLPNGRKRINMDMEVLLRCNSINDHLSNAIFWCFEDNNEPSYDILRGIRDTCEELNAMSNIIWYCKLLRLDHVPSWEEVKSHYERHVSSLVVGIKKYLIVPNDVGKSLIYQFLKFEVYFDEYKIIPYLLENQVSISSYCILCSMKHNEITLYKQEYLNFQ